MYEAVYIDSIPYLVKVNEDERIILNIRDLEDVAEILNNLLELNEKIKTLDSVIEKIKRYDKEV